MSALGGWCLYVTEPGTTCNSPTSTNGSDRCDEHLGRICSCGRRADLSIGGKPLCYGCKKELGIVR